MQYASAKMANVTVARAGADVEKLGLSPPAGGNAKRCSHLAGQPHGFLESETCTYHVTYNPTPGIHIQ